MPDQTSVTSDYAMGYSEEFLANFKARYGVFASLSWGSRVPLMTMSTSPPSA